MLNLRTSWLATPLALVACAADTTPPPSAPDAARPRADARATPDSGAAASPDARAMDATALDSGDQVADAGFLDAMFADAEPAPDVGTAPCTYPSGAPDRPTVDQTLARYQWSRAVDLAGMAYSLDMQEVFCATDTDIDWTAFPHVLFMAVPAW